MLGMVGAMIEPKVDRSLKLPSSAPTLFKQFRTYITASTTSNASAPSQYNTWVAAMNPWPVTTYIEFDYTAGQLTGASQDASGWALFAPDVLCGRQIAASILCSPIGNVLERGGNLSCCYYLFDTTSSGGGSTETGKQLAAGTGVFPVGAGIESYWSGFRGPVSQGCYCTWVVPSMDEITTWQRIDGDAAAIGDRGKQAGFFFRADTPDFTAVSAIFNVEIISNMEFLPLDATFAVDIDIVFVSYAHLMKALELLKYYPRIVANHHHVAWIDRIKKALAFGTKAIGTIKTFANAAEVAVPYISAAISAI